MIIKKFNLFLEKVVLTKSSNSGSTKQNDTILDNPSNNRSLSSLLLLNNKLKIQEYIDLFKILKIKISKSFLNKLLNSNLSDSKIKNLIIMLNNQEFLKKKLQKNGILKCEYCGKSPLLVNIITPEDIINNDIKRISDNMLATCDHKHPKSKGGYVYDYSNFAVCCKKCNEIKSDMYYDEWLYLMNISNQLIQDMGLNNKNFDTMKKSKLYKDIENPKLRKDIRDFIINKVNNTTLIKESKQVGFLYHFTNTDGLIGILNDNFLRPYHDYDMDKVFVSFTRNKNYLNEPGSKGKGTQLVRLTIDGDKLSDNYKLSPKHNMFRGVFKKPHGTGKYNKDEFEEVVDKGISKIKDYILSIDIDKDSLIKLFTFNNYSNYYGEPKVKMEKAKEEAFKDFKDFISKLDKFGINYNFTILNRSL